MAARAGRGKDRDQFAHLRTGVVQPAARIDRELRAAPLILVRNLFRQYRRKPLLSHAGSRQNPCLLHRFGSRRDRNGVDLGVGPGLEQQRDVEDGEFRPGSFGVAQKSLPRRPHQRMDDALQAPQGILVVEHARRKPFPVDRAVLGHAGKRGFDRRDRVSAIKFVNNRVGIEHRHALVAEHRGGRGLAHADRSRQAEDHHGPCLCFHRSSQG